LLQPGLLIITRHNRLQEKVKKGSLIDAFWIGNLTPHEGQELCHLYNILISGPYPLRNVFFLFLRIPLNINTQFITITINWEFLQSGIPASHSACN